MNFLAVDTSSEYCSVALSVDGQIFTEAIHAGQRHSDILIPMIDGLLKKVAVDLTEIDAIAFGAGPGSFTGLRIACGVTQGLAFATDKPVIAVSTLLALAHASSAERVISCIDARMQEVYFAAYERRGGDWVTVVEPSLHKPTLLPDIPQGEWTGCGSGFAAYREILMQRYPKQIDQCFPELFPQAKNIIELAIPMFKKGKFMRAEHAAPLYIRDKVALTMEEQ